MGDFWTGTPRLILSSPPYSPAHQSHHVHQHGRRNTVTGRWIKAVQASCTVPTYFPWWMDVISMAGLVRTPTPATWQPMKPASAWHGNRRKQPSSAWELAGHLMPTSRKVPPNVCLGMADPNIWSFSPICRRPAGAPGGYFL